MTNVLKNLRKAIDSGALDQVKNIIENTDHADLDLNNICPSNLTALQWWAISPKDQKRNHHISVYLAGLTLPDGSSRININQEHMGETIFDWLNSERSKAANTTYADSSTRISYLKSSIREAQQKHKPFQPKSEENLTASETIAPTQPGGTGDLRGQFLVGEISTSEDCDLRGIKFTKETHFSPSLKIISCPPTLGYYAAEIGNLSLLKVLKKNGLLGEESRSKVDYFEKSATATSASIKNGHLECSKFLYNHFQSSHGDLFSTAARFGRVEIGKFLIEQGEKKVLSSELPFHTALAHGQVDFCKMLLGMTRNNASKHSSTLYRLLKKVSNPPLRAEQIKSTYKGNSSFYYAGLGGADELIDILKKHLKLSTYGLEALNGAAEGGNTTFIECLVEKGVGLSENIPASKNPIAIAARHENLETLQYLLTLPNAKKLLNKFDSQNPPALYSALEKGHEDVAIYLVKAGAVLTNPLNREPCLHLAASLGMNDLIPLLLNEGIDIDSEFNPGPDGNKFSVPAGSTPLQCAIIHASGKEKDLSTMQLLLNAGASTGKSANGQTALMSALVQGPQHPEALELLLEQEGIDVNETSTFSEESGSTEIPPLAMVVAGNYGIDIFKKLVDAGADTDFRVDNLNILSAALPPKNLPVLKFLLKNIDKSKLQEYANEPGHSNFKPIFFAIVSGNTQILEAVLEAGADIESAITISSDSLSQGFPQVNRAVKMTPLNFALMISHAPSEMIRLLIERSKDLTEITEIDKLTNFNALVSAVARSGQFEQHPSRSLSFSKDAIDVMLAKQPELIDSRDTYGATVLHTFAIFSPPDTHSLIIFDHLLKANPNLDLKLTVTPELLALQDQPRLWFDYGKLKKFSEVFNISDEVTAYDIAKAMGHKQNVLDKLMTSELRASLATVSIEENLSEVKESLDLGMNM